jgi:hypothetical protein
MDFSIEKFDNCVFEYVDLTDTITEGQLRQALSLNHVTLSNGTILNKYF